jgi:SulP family sulfate permease
MSTLNVTPRAATPPLVDLFTPKLITVLRESYGASDLYADAVAGLTVAIVALPLSMAIAVASGVAPERGLYTAIVGGFLISLLGGSRFQIGGPAGAFIVLVASIVAHEGYDGLVMATLVAGVVLVVVGYLRLGTYIKYIPYPVVIGFTAGIAIIIAASQIHEILGLTLANEPGDLLAKIPALWNAAATAKPETIALSAFSIAVILVVHRWRPHWPAFLIAVVAAAAIVAALKVDVATLGSRFGGVPSGLPTPALPTFTLAKLTTAIPNGLALALLGAIESLLSAMVADGMTGRRHRSNCELVAQGVANIASVLFGGICVTGTIARTATNIRAGAKGPVSGILHSVYLLLFVVFAAPLIAFIPLATLGAVLLVVSWNMAEKAEFWALIRTSRADALVLLATFGLTLAVDLTTGITVGVVLGAFLFMHRMAEAVEVASGLDLITEDQSDYAQARTAYDAAVAVDPEIMVYSIRGALFFGATGAVSTVLDRGGAWPKAFILDFAGVPLVDSTGANALRGLIQKLHRSGARVYFTGTRAPMRQVLVAAGLDQQTVHYADRIDEAFRLAKAELAPTTG